jgi:hypothetical protein
MKDVAAAHYTKCVTHLNHSVRPIQAARSTDAAGRSNEDSGQALSTAISIGDPNGLTEFPDAGGGECNLQLNPVHAQSKIVHKRWVQGMCPI